ncbi:hypothetical protein [Umezawaea tangerina]|uniref:Uncharacterized protein n=1 Tax=Umezawaea tangerina TaxID=84725 RepID=A0A2T0T4I5_9PSEU|nr:hypothetical protein [Umezawaea tangerina]PRY40539.1 hypothetical protein CLV43_106276 [Umezawaea tangerina]
MTFSRESLAELRQQLLRDLAQVRERGIVRVDSPNPSLKSLEIVTLRQKVQLWDASHRAFTVKVFDMVSQAVADMPSGIAKRAAARLFGFDVDPTHAKPTQWRNEARNMFPLLGADDWRKGMELEILGLVVDNLIASQSKNNNLTERREETAANLESVSDLEYSVTTAFWAGRYSESATMSQTFLELAITRRDFEIAALFLANLILINRSRGRFSIVYYLMCRYFPQIPVRKLPNEYKLRLFKELFVYYYELEDFARSARYLERMERIDPFLLSYTPSDDWIPGTVRWRKAHLGWILEPTSRSLHNSLAIAQEGVEYLQGRVAVNPNTAGLASAKLNVGWLYFLEDNPICLDYFDESASLADGYSPRTLLESRTARMVAASKFATGQNRNIWKSWQTLRSAIESDGSPTRSYAFLARDQSWSAIWPHLATLGIKLR